MHPKIKDGVILSMVAALLFLPFAAAGAVSQEAFVDDQPDALKIGVDVLLVRPLGIVSTAVGSALYLISLPFCMLSGDTSTPWEKLVVEPARFTFNRPVGKF